MARRGVEDQFREVVLSGDENGSVEIMYDWLMEGGMEKLKGFLLSNNEMWLAGKQAGGVEGEASNV